MKLYSIGHSNHSLEKFTSLINELGIMNIVDVRTSPYSRYSPQYNKESLEFELPRYNINYIFAGKHLGGRPKDPNLYKNRKLAQEETDYLHEVDYPEVMKRPWFVQAIHRLLEIVEEDLTAIMCSEEDPALCHRHHLIAKYLIAIHPEIEVYHIRGDSTVYGARSIMKSVETASAEQPKLF